MTEAEAIQAWKSSAIEDMQTSDELFESTRYHHALFFLHLALEKIIKGIHQYRKHEPSLFIHDLDKLARHAGINAPEEDKLKLDEISTFNVAARYDIFKLRLYRKATPEYSKTWMERGKELFDKYVGLLP